MNLEDDLHALDRHPVGSLTPDARLMAHSEVIGGILAAIAMRKQPRPKAIRRTPPEL